jgi:hypothetical protein
MLLLLKPGTMPGMLLLLLKPGPMPGTGGRGGIPLLLLW